MGTIFIHRIICNRILMALKIVICFRKKIAILFKWKVELTGVK